MKKSIIILSLATATLFTANAQNSFPSNGTATIQVSSGGGGNSQGWGRTANISLLNQHTGTQNKLSIGSSSSGKFYLGRSTDCNGCDNKAELSFDVNAKFQGDFTVEKNALFQKELIVQTENSSADLYLRKQTGGNTVAQLNIFTQPFQGKNASFIFASSPLGNNSAVLALGVGYEQTLVVRNSQQVSIGLGINEDMPGANGEFKLAVNGGIIAEKVQVALKADWPDYVFSEDHELMNLTDLEDFVEENNHLPNVPNAAEVKEQGVDLGEMQRIQMEKIEELTLYVLQLSNENNALKTQVTELASKL